MAKHAKNLKKKVASLSALGAGALVFGAAPAEAGIIYSGVLDAPVGFTSGTQFYISPGIGASNASFAFWATGSSSPSYGSRSIRAYGYGGLAIARQFGLIQLFNQGAVWTSGMLPSTSLLVGGRYWGSYTSYYSGRRSYVSAFGHPPFNNEYALFVFDQGGNTFYGWMQLSYSVSAQFGPDGAFGPELTIHDFAWDDSGALIQAGQTVDGSAVPEPGTFASAGLAALALGAVGLRSWRKNRKAA